jgi:hypothetical protein
MVLAAHDKSLTMCLKCMTTGLVNVAKPRKVLLPAGEAAANCDPCKCACWQKPCPCGETPDNIVMSGAATVLVGPDMAPFARFFDFTKHATVSKWPSGDGIVMGTFNVLVNGATVVGEIAKFNRICLDQGKQKYDNCALECSRQILRANGLDGSMSQEQMLAYAAKRGYCELTIDDSQLAAYCPEAAAADRVYRAADQAYADAFVRQGTPQSTLDRLAETRDNAYRDKRRKTEDCLGAMRTNDPTRYNQLMQNPGKTSGRTSTEQQRDLLRSKGLTATDKQVTGQEIMDSAKSGKGAILSVDSGAAGLGPEGEAHAVVLTGAVYDSEGKLTGVMVNDPSGPNCGYIIPADNLKRAGAVHSIVTVD